MGKGARTRRQRSSAVVPPATVGSEAFFHGGVPGKEVGDLLLSAAQLRLRYQYLVVGAKYDPGWVYVTTDMGVAEAYASRYLTADNQHVPGDLYEVEPVGSVQLDPDYPLFGGVFTRCRQARIVRVVALGIVLTEAEQGRCERRYKVWGHPDRPIWDDDGLIIPSEQMLTNGVTREWTTLLRPWLGLGDVDAHGRLLIARRSADFWATVLEVVPSLDRKHRVARRQRWPRPARYQCVFCAESTNDPQQAAQHQLGAATVALIAQIHRLPLPVVMQELVEAASDRDGSRWTWRDE